MMPYSSGKPVLQDPIVSQRNPFEVFLLVSALWTGLLALAGFDVSPAIEEQSRAVVLMWAWTLAVGGGLGLFGVSLPLRYLGFSLNVERTGMILMTGGVLVYAWVVWDESGGDVAWTVLSNVSFGLACGVRVWQITKRYRWYRREHERMLWLRAQGRSQ